MATGKEWMGEVRRLSPHEAERKARALNEILSWDFFKQEFEGMGLEFIRSELEIRGNDGWIPPQLRKSVVRLDQIEKDLRS